MQPAERSTAERWFRRRGLPLLIEGRNAEEDVWTRALPFLVVVFLAESLNAVNADWPFWVNLLALAAGFAFLISVWMVINLVRGRRATEPPHHIGALELAIFVLVPAFLPALFGNQLLDAGATILFNVAVLGAAFVVVDIGLVSMVRWSFVQIGQQIGDVIGVVVRALPLLLLFMTFLFINAEAWQVASSLPWAVLAIVGGLFFVVGALFAVLRVPRQIRELSEPVELDECVQLLADTPTPLGAEASALPEHQPLSRRQWGNVGMVILVSEGAQVFMVTLMVFGFFTLFGFLAIGADVIESWTAGDAEVIWTLTVGDQVFVLTEELLKVAVFLASFSGLYFTVSMLTDATYRAEFLDDIVEEVRRSLLVHDVYVERFVQAPAET